MNNNTKEKIIISARNLFSQYGYKKVSMSDIAINANLTKKTIYSYFKTKEELFEYFINEELFKMKSMVDEIENSNLDFSNKLHEMIFRLIKYKKSSKFLKIITKEMNELRYSDVVKFDDKINHKILKFIENKLEVAIDRNEIKKVDVKFVGFIIYTLYVSLFSYPSDKLDEKKISDTFTQIIKEGLLVKGD